MAVLDAGLSAGQMAIGPDPALAASITGLQRLTFHASTSSWLLLHDDERDIVERRLAVNRATQQALRVEEQMLLRQLGLLQRPRD